ncbi:MAG: PglZ domain-containing protein, partial [Anaerolineales bacterium]
AWRKVDRAYRRFRAELDRGLGQLDSALKWTQRMYQDFLEGINGHFVEALVQADQWPPSGSVVGAGPLWESTPGQRQERRGVILADALRYELGHELAERLQSGPEATLEAALSPLPSVTALGMAALLPGWLDFRVDYAGGAWAITAPGFEGNLAVKGQRLAWLGQRLGGVSVFDLDRWLSTPLTGVPQDTDWIIVTSAEIDALGEGAAAVAWHAFEALLDRLEQAVRRLLAAGCTEVHVVSDHGFLLREDIRETDKVAIKDKDVLKKAERYLVGRDLPPTDLPSMPVSGSDGLMVWFPRSVACFVTRGPYNYMHGGISLQELVTAHVTVQQSVTERPVGVSMELVAGPEIRNAIFKIKLTPVGMDLWTRARQVRVDIAREGERISREWEAVIEREVVEMPLHLKPESALMVGDDVAIRVWDAVTGELLAQQPATVYVSLDL